MSRVCSGFSPLSRAATAACGPASLAFAVLVVILVPAGAAYAAPQAGVLVRGQVLHSLTGEPVIGAKVIFQEDRRQTLSGSEGRFQFEKVNPGTYHLSVEAQGFSARHQEFTAAAPDTIINLLVDPELHFEEIISVSAEPRDQFNTYQPTSVLTGQDLTRELGSTLSATLSQEPGVAERSFGAAPARPVVRGLDGDRVLILEDGQRMGDLSSQSGDHGITVNPAAATKIEVVRGPATLIYGANAIGGLVNVISDAVPSAPLSGMKGGFTGDVGSNGGQTQGAADLWWGNRSFALHVSGGGQRNGDYATPEGTVDNTHARSGFGSAGLSWTGERGHLGANYAYEDTRYGLPYVEDGQVELTPRRSIVNVRGELKDLEGFFRSVRGSFAGRRYKHEELVAGETGTRFSNDTNEFEFLGNHRTYGRFNGSLGGWALDRSFAATGEEALSPPVDQAGAAAYLYEEVTFHHATLQAGGRFDYASYTPFGSDLPARSFSTFSGSLGLLIQPPAFDHRSSIAVSVARTSRYPALEELYFFGPHPGNFAFEIGNPNLDPEHALGLDLSFRWRSARFSAEATYFRNRINDYIFRSPVEGEVDFEHHDEHGHEGEFPVIEYLAANSLLQGFELHGDVQVTPRIFADFGVDYVRGDLVDRDAPLPRIPPFRVRGSVRYQAGAFNAGAELAGVAAQERVFGAETTTDGYGLLKFFSSYSWPAGRSVSTITARLDNAANTLYRNHLSYVKDYVPEKGRTFKLVYSVRF
ncbi:MAG: TonB-dependent receptor [Vicinamibacterales bacterium]